MAVWLVFLRSAMQPQHPQPRLFYGWVMLGVAVLMAAATMPGQTVLMALFNTSIRESLGLSIQQISGAYTIGTILASLPLPFVGRVADRFGLRLTITAVVLGFIGSLLLLREATGIVMLGGIFFLVRFFGQGSLGMLCGHTIAMWFERKLGKANSILAIVGFAAASAIAPIPTAALIESRGWEFTLLVCAGAVAVLTIPSLLFVFRNKPEDIGQHLDGDQAEHTTHDVMHGGKPPAGDPSFTVKQAVETRAFWILSINMLLIGFIGTALLFHMQSMLQQGGLEGTEKQAAIAIQPWPISFGVAMFFVGFLADRYRPAKILPVAMLIQAGAILTCLVGARGLVESESVLLVMAIGMALFGVSQATIMGVANPTIARYFGRTHHGAIRGFVSTAVVMGTGGGPYVFAVGYGLAGEDFGPVMIVFACIAVPLGFVSALLRKPTPPAEPDRTPEPDEPDPPEVVI